MLQEVRYELLQKEHTSAVVENSADVSFVALVLSGLEIEDVQ